MIMPRFILAFLLVALVAPLAPRSQVMLPHRKVVQSPLVPTTPTTLTNDLIAYWKLDETSGDRIDSHSTNDLTPQSTGFTNAVISNGAWWDGSIDKRLIGQTDSPYSRGNTSFSFAGWCRLDTTNQVYPVITKFGIGAFEYDFFYANTTDRYAWRVSPDGSSVTTATANALGSPGLGVVHFFYIWHDSTNDVIGVAFDNAVTNTTAFASGVFDGAAAFNIGCRTIGATPSFNGFIDEVGFWGRTLTITEISSLYNGGSGKTYPFVP